MIRLRLVACAIAVLVCRAAALSAVPGAPARIADISAFASSPVDYQQPPQYPPPRVSVDFSRA